MVKDPNPNWGEMKKTAQKMLDENGLQAKPVASLVYLLVLVTEHQAHEIGQLRHRLASLTDEVRGGDGDRPDPEERELDWKLQPTWANGNASDTPALQEARRRLEELPHKLQFLGANADGPEATVLYSDLLLTVDRLAEFAHQAHQASLRR